MHGTEAERVCSAGPEGSLGRTPWEEHVFIKKALYRTLGHLLALWGPRFTLICSLTFLNPRFEVTACRDGSSPAPTGEFLLTFRKCPRTASASAADADVSRRKERRAPRSPAPDLGRPVRPAAAPSAPSRLFPPAWPLGDTRPAHRRAFPLPPAALGSDPRPFAPPHPQSSSCLREAVRGVQDGGEGVTARAPAGRPLTGSHTRERPVN